MKIGLGYDIHRLIKGKKLFLGGVEIPFKKGLLAHSDGDVILHAVSDAILGALGKGDIGEHFPDTDKKFRGIKSSLILAKVFDFVKIGGLKISNLDITLIAQEPKISPYKNKMKKNISGILKVTPDKINIKATTNEGIGLIGKEKAIAALVVVLLN